MSNNRNLGNIATAITNATTGQVLTSQGDGVATFADASGGVSTIGSLDFSPSAINETSTITTSSNMSNAPFISAFKEVPQTGVSTKGNWDVNSTASNYDLLDEAPLLYSGATITPSSATANGTFTLSSGSFSSSDIGKRVIGNSGEATITATDGSYVIHTSFANTNAIGAGGWKLRGLIVDSSAGLQSNRATVGFDFSSLAHTSGDTFDYSSQDNNAQDVSFKSDGTKMYISGNGSDKVHQYSLSEAWDATTASYDNISTALGDTSTVGHTFSADGTKLYGWGLTNDAVRRYDLNPAWDLSSSTFAHSSASMSPETSLTSVRFNSDGTKMYAIGDQYNKIYQWDLSPAWSVSGKSYSNVDASLSTSTILSESNPRGLHILPDGSTIYVVGSNSGAIYKLGLTSAGDISGGYSYSVSTDRYLYAGDDGMISSDYVPGLNVSADGTKLYLINGADDRLVQYSMGLDATPTSQYFTATTNSGGQIDTESWTDLNSLTADETLNDGATYYAFSTDGRTTWKVQNSSGDLRSIARLNSSIWQYNSSSNATTNFTLPSSALAFATGTASSYSSKYTVQPVSGSTDADVWDATMVPVGGVSGKGLVVTDRDSNSNGKTMRYFTLATAYDLSSTLTEVDISSTNWNPSGAINYYGGMFNPDGTKFFVTGKDGNYADIRQYNLTTAYDLSTATLQSDHFNSTHGFPQHYAYSIAGVSDSKIYLCRTGFHNYLNSKNLTSSGDIDTSHTTLTQEANLPNDSLNNVKISSDGKRIFAHDNQTTNHYLYTLTTAFDFTSLDSSATITNTSVDGLTNSQTKLQYDEEGKYIVGTNGSTNEVYLSPSSTFTAGNAFDHESWVNATNNNQQSALQQALGSQSANRLTGTDLATYSDANLLATGDTFDLMIGLYMGSTGTSPTSDAITISYDGAVQNKGAILGTDYDVEKLSDTQLKFTALTQKNMHFKVI